MVQRRMEPSEICITSISPINDFNVDLALHICFTSSVNMAVGLVPAHRLGLGPPHSHYTGVWWPLNRWHLSHFGFRSHEGYHHLHGMAPWIPLTRSFQNLVPLSSLFTTLYTMATDGSIFPLRMFSIFSPGGLLAWRQVSSVLRSPVLSFVFAKIVDLASL